MKFRTSLIIFGIIFLFGFIVRLYRFDNPIADWHSWRQADTSSVSRNFVNYGFDLFHPRMNNISNVQSGKENPQGYFYAEFPLYNAAQAGLFVLFGGFTIEEWGRLITICMSLLGSWFLFAIIKKRSKPAAWFALIFSIFLPYNVYYGRTILPDTSMVTMILGGIYFFDRWLEEKLKVKSSTFAKASADKQKSKVLIDHKYILFFLLALVFTLVALLLKPYALFYGLPFFVLTWSKYQIGLFRKWELWLFALVSIAPLLWWRYFMLAHPEGIPANVWLFNGNGIRFRPAFFRWIFYERIIKLISGYFNAIPFVFGLYAINKQKDRLFIYSFVFSALLYVCVIATGNVQHDYYQIVIMPSLVIGMAFGSVWLVEKLSKRTNNVIGYTAISLIIAVGFFLSWQQVKDYFNINNPAIVVAGKAVDRLIPKGAKVIAPYNGDSSFLYQTNRQGWASFDFDLPKLIDLGADYLVLVNPTSQDISFGKTYKTVSITSQYVLYNLHQKP